MQILKTTLIQFDEVAERERIETAFKGATRKMLLRLLDAFLACDWVACNEQLRNMSRKELEYVSCEIFDVMKERSTRNLMLEAHAAGELPLRSAAAIHQLGYPRFQIGAFID